MSQARNIVVIGGGPAGVFAAIGAKRQDPAAAVTLLTDEGCEPYEKPPLSKAVLMGKAAPHDAPIAGPQGLAGHGAILERNATCRAIDRANSEVVTAGGKRFPYDALVIATGSLVRDIPFLPPGMARVHYLRTEIQARALAAELKRSQHLVVIGGGLIGLEVAASAAELGVRTTVIEMAPRILARVCDQETGARIHEEHRRRGVDIRTGTALAAAHVAPDNSAAPPIRVCTPPATSCAFQGLMAWFGWRTGGTLRTRARSPGAMRPAPPSPTAACPPSGRSNTTSIFRAWAGHLSERSGCGDPCPATACWFSRPTARASPRRSASMRNATSRPCAG